MFINYFRQECFEWNELIQSLAILKTPAHYFSAPKR